MRTVRKQCESEIYHVIARGAGRQLIFEDDGDREFFLTLLEKHARERSVDVLAWCLMGNHFHLLVHAPMERVSLCMKDLCGLYAQHFNKVHARVGHLFQERFRSEPVADEGYLAMVVGYIHFNPDKAGLADYKRYPWSSYAEYLGKSRKRQICAKELVLGHFGGLDAFKEFHKSHAAEAQAMDVDAPRSPTRSMPDGDAIALAEDILEGRGLGEVKALPRSERNFVLRKLLDAGLSIRQIERLTGVGRGVVQSVTKQKYDK